MLRSIALKSLVSLAAGVLLVACGSNPVVTSVVEVSFDVVVPSNTPAEATVMLVGSHLSLGAGSPGGLKLRHDPDGHFRASAFLTKGQAVTYHVQLANPLAFELDDNGNRRERDLTPGNEPSTAELTVIDWEFTEGPILPVITFIVTVPSNTPSDATLYIAGNHDVLGPWNPGKQTLEKQADGTYAVDLLFPAGTQLEYKYTRGSWATVEGNATGGQLNNRTLDVTETMTVRDTVLTWEDLGVP